MNDSRIKQSDNVLSLPLVVRIDPDLSHMSVGAVSLSHSPTRALAQMSQSKLDQVDLIIYILTVINYVAICEIVRKFMNLPAMPSLDPGLF